MTFSFQVRVVTLIVLAADDVTRSNGIIPVLWMVPHAGLRCISQLDVWFWSTNHPKV